MSINMESHGLYQPARVQFVDSGSLITHENLSSSVEQTKCAAMSVIPFINLAAGGFSAWYGTRLTSQGIFETRQAALCGDRRGALNGAINTGAGATFAGMGGAMFASGVSELLPACEIVSVQTSQILIKIFTVAMNWLGLVMYGLYFLGSLFVAFPEIREFRGALHDMLHIKRTCAKTKAIESLHFLKNNLYLTDNERKEGKSLQDLEKLQLAKWSRLVRCIGPECAERVKRQLPELLQEVKEGNLINAEKLLEAVDRASFKAGAMQIATLVAGILGVIGSIFAITMASGYASFIFFAAASALYWLNDSICSTVINLYPISTGQFKVCYKPAHGLI